MADVDGRLTSNSWTHPGNIFSVTGKPHMILTLQWTTNSNVDTSTSK